MNREIKFRIWDKLENKFLTYPMYINNQNGKELTAFDRYFHVDEDNLVIQQYTGCFDCNKTDIYEGDIIEYTAFEKPIKGYVEFFAGIFHVNWNDQTDTELGYMQIDKMKVIGNMFQNKELLQ